MRVVVFFLLHAWLLCFFQQPCISGDTLNTGEKIIGNGTILTSARKQFDLGFFSPPGISITERYLGIWYSQQDSTEPLTVVWVANRDHPIAADSTGVFQIAEDGNLVVVDTYGRTYWSSKLVGGSTTLNRSVKLMDSGNLVLLDDHLGNNLWESFHHPTDTFLPGMNMDKNNLELTCWRGPDDPGSGSFTFRKSQTMDDNSFVIYNQSQVYWASERHGDAALNSEASGDDDLNITVYMLLTNISGKAINNPCLMDHLKPRLMINSTGMVQFRWNNSQQGEPVWYQPKTKCLIYNFCGNFSSCNDNLKLCRCLPGFFPVRSSPAQNEYILGEEGDYLEDPGCARRPASSTCRNDTTTFLNLVMMRIGNPDKQVRAANESECRSVCLNMCNQCHAYSYNIPRTRRDLPFNCWIWTQDLTTLKEESSVGVQNLFVRVDKSDIAPTPRTCKPCGTTVVPYPLSTGESCGDPKYFKFSCNVSTGQLSYTTINHSYRVIGIKQKLRKFYLQDIRDLSFSRYCGQKPRSDESLQLSSPFSKTDDNLCDDQVEVTWQPPSEPRCAKSIDCQGWKHSTCKGKRCLCDANYIWNGDLLKCTENAVSPSNPTSEKPAKKGNSKRSLLLILGITLPCVFILACAIIFAYVFRHKIAFKQDRESTERDRRNFDDTERYVKELINMERLEEKGNKGIEVPYVDLKTILAATDNFSDENKLGRGGYGPVYKGTLQGGQEIAVKRLSNVSSQGLQEFKNEVVLISKLQHRNLVRLKGYCIKGDEKILLYEYMPNKSLDSFLFHPTRSILLNWPMRFDIVFGIAKGLLYLHQDSRLRVIHRDLKSSNILLDAEMQPKISDFGLAKIFGSKETKANTGTIAGTYGYMSPEYALNGIFSTKSDIFSFGVVLLETISGKKNTGFYPSEEVSSLLGYAWKLWEDNKLLDLMELSLRETCDASQFIRCAHIGLLCVQDEPDDRPNMSNVMIMLESEIAALPTPKEPLFFGRRGHQSCTASSSSTAIRGSQLLSTTEEGR